MPRLPANRLKRQLGSIIRSGSPLDDFPIKTDDLVRHDLPGKHFIHAFDRRFSPFPAKDPDNHKAGRAIPTAACGSFGGIKHPVTASFTVNFIPPTFAPITGVPHAMDSRGVMPNGSYQGVVMKTSAALK